MEEIVYTILYKKELLSEEQNSYHYIPCYVIKGLYDEEENIFLDEINKTRYSIYDERSVLENCEYVVGEIYTEKDLKNKYPNSVSFEQIEIDLFQEEERNMIIGVFDKTENKLNISKYSYDGLTKHNDKNEVINEDLNANDNEGLSKFDYNNLKNRIGMDFSMFAPDQVNIILTMENIDEIHRFIYEIKNSKDKYEQIVKKNAKERYICLADNIVDFLIESEQIDEIKDMFIYYNNVEPGMDDEIDDYTIGEEDEEYEEGMVNIFGAEDFDQIIAETLTKIEKAENIEEVKDNLYNLNEFYQNNISILEMLRENGYKFFTSYHFFLSQLSYINELLKLDNMNTIKREYKLSYIRNKSIIEKVSHELEYEVEKTEMQKIYQQVSQELNELVGLENVKTMFNSIFASILFKNKTNQNLELEDNNKHMVFTGNPGTGKTTVAEIIAPLFYKLGYIETDKVAFVAAEDLIAGYVGQTAIKTKNLIQQNQGGIIVIDEAYILSSPAQQFGNEAITVILKEMEKNRTMFIFAGYKKEMEEFIKMNSGLKSRVNSYIQFEDYSEKELLTMFMNRIKKSNKDNSSKNKLTVSLKALQKIKETIKDGKKEKDFGNGRFVKNIFDIILMEHAKNTKDIIDNKMLYQITEKDIPDDILEKVLFGEEHSNSNYSNNTIGFGAKVKLKK